MTSEPRADRVTVELTVPFHDVDALGVVWHGHYYKYMEIARSALLARFGLDSPDLSYEDYGLRMIESACRHLRPLRYGDRVTVTAWLKEIEQRIVIAYRLETGDHPVARGRTTLVTVDRDGALQTATPESVLRRLERPS